ncbi:protein tyrosine phosphatase domain-containing protein 1 [Labrus bergylta]|uniref:protein tyrosine phosphatase domain-containing protein 1 n=1 Tax=Labrus bergylta TaxID=56723 RepID=UPI0010FB9B12|nr:protein tyrosine phosphatase domain-containing protein 1-like [Labrus bergylta]
MIPTLVLNIPIPRPSYSQARENLVKAIPSKLLCLLACGGLDCRYEGPECWKQNQQVIRGVYSFWLNIKSIINMQLPGEHAHCGPLLDLQSGFTYSPQTFMENDSGEPSSLIGCTCGGNHVQRDRRVQHHFGLRVESLNTSPSERVPVEQRDTRHPD